MFTFRKLCSLAGVISTAIFMLTIPESASAYIGLCCAKCGGNMPMNIPGGGIPETHEFRFKIQPMLMRMEDLRRGRDDTPLSDVLGMPAMGKYMAAPTSMDMRMLNIAAGYSFTDDFFAGVMGMYVDNEMDMRFNSTMQTMTGQNGFTMKSDGLADTMLMAKYRVYADDPLFPTREASLFFSLSIPTGSIDKRNTTHPLAMRKTELLPYNMQLGSGTWDPTLGFLFQRSTSPFWWGLDGRFTFRIHDNKRDYRLGNRIQADAYLMYQPRYNLNIYGEINGDWLGHIRGEMDEARAGTSGRASKGDPNSPYMTPLWDPDFTGHSKVFATIGMQFQPKPFHILDFGVQLPVYQRLNGLQLKDAWRIMATWYIELPTSKSIRYRKKK